MARPRDDLREMPDPSECLPIDAFLSEFRTGLDEVMERPTKALGTSPRAAFDAAMEPLVRVDPGIVALTLLRGRTSLHRVRNIGIEFHGNEYVAAELAHFVGHDVTVGWKGRAEAGPPELAVFLVSEEARRIKRQLMADRAIRRARTGRVWDAEEGMARGPSGPLIDDRGAELVLDYLCTAVRKDLAGPDLIARITGNRERYIVTVKDAEHGGEKLRRRLLHSVQDTESGSKTVVRRDPKADQAARRRAAADRERARGAS